MIFQTLSFLFVLFLRGWGWPCFFFYEQCMVAEHCFDVREIVQVFCLSAKKGFLSVPSVGINDGCPCCSRQVFEFEDIPGARVSFSFHTDLSFFSYNFSSSFHVF